MEKKYWVEIFIKRSDDGTEIKMCYECDKYTFAKSRYGREIVLENANSVTEKNGKEVRKQFKRNVHEPAEKYWFFEYIEVVIFENGTDNVIYKYASDEFHGMH